MVPAHGHRRTSIPDASRPRALVRLRLLLLLDSCLFVVAYPTEAQSTTA